MTGRLRDITTVCSLCLRRTPWYKVKYRIIYLRLFRIVILLFCNVLSFKQNPGKFWLNSVLLCVPTSLLKDRTSEILYELSN